MEADDEFAVLKETLAAGEARLARLDKLIEMANRPPRPLEVSVAEPKSAVEVLALAEAKLADLVADPESCQADRQRAMLKLCRAKAAAEEEAVQSRLPGAMARSLDLRAADIALRDSAVAKRERERASAVAKSEREREAAAKAVDTEKWRYARRQRYIGG